LDVAQRLLQWKVGSEKELIRKGSQKGTSEKRLLGCGIVFLLLLCDREESLWWEKSFPFYAQNLYLENLTKEYRTTYKFWCATPVSKFSSSGV